MSQASNWYVLTGGPSTGKTTLLGELAALGHITVPEAARWVIDQGVAQGLSVKDIRKDEKQFQIDVLNRKVEVESAQDKGVVTFFDRAMHDTLAYLTVFGFKLESWMEKTIQSSVYRKIFVLDPLPVFTGDYTRTEDQSTISKLNDLLFEAYNQAGMETLRVPALPVDERLKFVLDNIDVSQKQGIKT